VTRIWQKYIFFLIGITVSDDSQRDYASMNSNGIKIAENMGETRIFARRAIGKYDQV